MNEKLKSLLLNDQLFYGFIVILVALASFGLGRASMADLIEATPESQPTVAGKDASVPPAPVTTEKAGAPTVALASSRPATATTATTYVASKSGTKYHLLTCPGAKSIKEENKVYFATVLEAEAAGYKPAANCPELQ